MKLIKSSRGFTLIELMVVIAIIAILSGIIITSLTQSKSKARDAQRVSDLNQIQLALEQYFNRCGTYPSADLANGGPLTTSSCTTGGATVTINSYISVIPKDPSTGKSYDYVVNNQATPTDYLLHTKLENPNSTQQNSYPESLRTQNSWMSLGSNASCYSPTIGGSSASYALLSYCISTK